MRVCFFGDSFTNGTGDDTCPGWVGRVCSAQRQAGNDLTSYNLGVRRDTSTDIALRWRQEAGARLPPGIEARLVFSFGSNDTAIAHDLSGPRLTLAHSLQNARYILTAAREMAPTLMIGPPPAFTDENHNDRILRFSNAIEELCREISLPFLNLTTLQDDFWLIWRDEAEKGDGVHPNSKGYESLARVIGEWQAVRGWHKRPD